MKKPNIIRMKDENGKEIDARVLFTVEDDKSKKNYMVYTTDEKDENGRVKTFASTYELNENEEIFQIDDIKTDKEWEFIEKILNSLQKESKK